MSRMIPTAVISYIAGDLITSGSVLDGMVLILCVLTLIGFEIRDDYQSTKET